MSLISYWERTSFLPDYDYIIIGAGIVGCFCALHLKEKEPQAKIAILERGLLPTGASTKNAGFACFGSLSELIEQYEKSSEEEMLAIVEKRWRGLGKLRQTLGDDMIDLQMNGGYELFSAGGQGLFDRCLERMTYFNELLQPIVHGDKSSAMPVFSVCNESIPEFGFGKTTPLIRNHYEAQIDSGRMMRELIRQVHASGVFIFFSSDVQNIAHHPGDIHVETAQHLFHTRKLIVTTNAFAKQLYPSLDVVPGRGQVLITKPIPGLKLKGCYHMEKGFFYFRNIHDRVLFGGGRNYDLQGEETYAFGETETIMQYLKHYLDEVILPGIPYEIDMTWSGIMGFGNELSPIVKEIAPDTFCAVRCNGMGVAMGSLLGEEVAGLSMRN